ncbi:MAG: hypothetical protein CM1200mP2_13940 [Planctomycetaceae bacterium]|nr:MAG: hypothetical protein CM1200mP2_13940 [Planctomycetaceae bacterium]
MRSCSSAVRRQSRRRGHRRRIPAAGPAWTRAEADSDENAGSSVNRRSSSSANAVLISPRSNVSPGSTQFDDLAGHRAGSRTHFQDSHRPVRMGFQVGQRSGLRPRQESTRWSDRASRVGSAHGPGEKKSHPVSPRSPHPFFCPRPSCYRSRPSLGTSGRSFSPRRNSAGETLPLPSVSNVVGPFAEGGRHLGCLDRSISVLGESGRRVGSRGNPTFSCWGGVSVGVLLAPRASGTIGTSGTEFRAGLGLGAGWSRAGTGVKGREPGRPPNRGPVREPPKSSLVSSCPSPLLSSCSNWSAALASSSRLIWPSRLRSRTRTSRGPRPDSGGPPRRGRSPGRPGPGPGSGRLWGRSAETASRPGIPVW